MAIFPVAYVGLPLTADFWNSAQTNTIVKGSNTPRSNTATLADDPELAGMELGVGTYEVQMHLHASVNPSVQNLDIRVAWAFTGTATVQRLMIGPDEQIGGPSQYFNSGSSTHINTNSTRTLAKLGGNTGNALTTSIAYGLNDIYPVGIHEIGIFDVTAIGNWSIQWAQQTAGATASCSVYAGSYITARRIA
jgi:hypothetical protein